MSKWLPNLIAYEENKEMLKCPYCHGDNVEVLHYDGTRESVTFICKDCKKSEHFDGTVKNTTHS